MKVVLINPPIQMQARGWYPLGLGYIASAMLQENIDVEIVDCLGENLSRKGFASRISNISTKFFGIGGLVTAFNNVVDVIAMIRELHPDAFIFAGNSVGYSIPETILRHTTLDAVVMGEGETTSVELIKSLSRKGNLNDVNGIIFKDQQGEIRRTPPRLPIANIDSVPFPAWSLLPMENYFANANHRYCLVSTVRGCPYQCKYCCKTYIGYPARFRSPESIMSELLAFHKKYNISHIYFWDDLTTINKERMKKICELKMKSELADIPFNLSARVNLVDDDLIRILKQSNCFRIGFGIESLDQGVLDSIGKKTTVAQIEQSVEICERHELDYADSSFMVGAINETEETIRKSSEFCKKHNLRYEPHFMTAFPGTELYEYALKEKLIVDELDYVKKLALQGNTNFLLVNVCKYLSDEELITYRNKYLFFPGETRYTMLKRFLKKIFLNPRALLKLINPDEIARKIRLIFYGPENYKGSFDRYSNKWE